MSNELLDNFISGYLQSLSEESANTKKGPRYGIDRVISQLELSQNHIPIRLPYFRQGRDTIPKPIKENEHGVDFAFLTPDRKSLRIFVLKRGKLTSRSFLTERMDFDIRRAALPDLTDQRLAEVLSVVVILAYNGDDDEEGREDYSRLVQTLGTKVGDNISLSFDRWNLTSITESVKSKLLTPSILPENLSRKFTFICHQYGEFDARSRYWNDLLIPDWKQFLKQVLTPPVSERTLRMIPVILIILKKHAKQVSNVDFSTSPGWLEIVEWATLECWSSLRKSPEKNQKKLGQICDNIQVNFYLEELLLYYRTNEPHLTVEKSLNQRDSIIGDVASSYTTYWHLGRLGLLALLLEEYSVLVSKEHRKIMTKELNWCCDLIINLTLSNESSLRPMLDIQHLELFLTWRALASAGRHQDLYNILIVLLNRLHMRQQGYSRIPWIDHRNSWEFLFEDLIDKTPLSKANAPSYLLLMLTEICALMPQGEAFKQIIENSIIPILSQDKSSKNITSIELMGWMPADSWFDDILNKQATEGYGVPFNIDPESPIDSVHSYIKSTQSPPPSTNNGIGFESVYLLACLKHQSPLPSWFWRKLMPINSKEPSTANSNHT